MRRFPVRSPPLQNETVGRELPRQKQTPDVPFSLFSPGAILSKSIRMSISLYQNISFVHTIQFQVFFVCGLIRKLALLLRCKFSEWHLDRSSAMQDWAVFKRHYSTAVTGPLGSTYFSNRCYHSFADSFHTQRRSLVAQCIVTLKG
jgi:hypothetical protein